MKKIIIAALFITALAGAYFFLFIPGEIKKDDLLDDLDKKQSAFESVGDYFIHHEELDPKYVYEQDAASFGEISSDIKKVLDDHFLYISIDRANREIVFGTASQEQPDDHKLIYSPFNKPKGVANAEMTKKGGWYIKM